MTTFQGLSAKRHSNKKNFKSGQNQPNAVFIFITFRNHRQQILMLFPVMESRDPFFEVSVSSSSSRDFTLVIFYEVLQEGVPLKNGFEK